MKLYIYHYVYLLTTLIVDLLFYPFNIYILLNYNVEQYITKSYLLAENIYTTIGITLIVTLLVYTKIKNYLEKERNYVIYTHHNNIQNKINYFIVFIMYIYNIVNSIVTIIYLYTIDKKYITLFDLSFGDDSYINKYMLYRITASYFMLLFNIVVYIYVINCK